MSNGVTKNYKFGQKNNWRRAVWNDIASRITDKKNSMVGYLSGLEDLDRKVAIEKGFNPNNLIAIDKSKKITEELRKKGKISFHGDMQDFLLSWTGHPKINVIHADLCGPLNNAALNIARMAICSISDGGVISLNLLRGRDKVSNLLRSTMHTYIEYFFEDYELEDIHLHRGKQLYLMLNSWALLEKSNARSIDASTNYQKWFREGIFKKEKLNINPQFRSYKSKCNGAMLVFDSIIFNNKFGISFSNYESDKYVMTETQQISALKAIRTMRINGRLSHSAIR